MIEAHDAEAVERHVLDELAEGFAHGVEIAVVVEMLGIDIGDDGDVGRQFQEGAVGFVGLDHHPLALAHAGIGAVGIDDAAIDDGRIEPAGSSSVATSEVVVVLPCVPPMATHCGSASVRPAFRRGARPAAAFRARR
jgi:hypothetical protein